MAKRLYRVVLVADGTAVSEKAFEYIDDAIDTMVALEEFDKAEGVYAANTYGIKFEEA